MALAVIAGTGQVAYAQPGLGVGLQLNSGNPVVVGNSYTGRFTLTNTSNPLTTETTVGGVALIPACTDVPLPGFACATPDSGVFDVTAAASISGCGAVTWAVTGGPATFTITPTPAVVLTTTTPCIVEFNFDVLQLPSVDADDATPSTLETGGSAAGAVTPSAGGVGTTSTPFDISCDVLLDKQVSCDGGDTWHDVLFGTGPPESEADGGCIGDVGENDIKVRYFARNISDSGIDLLSCEITESNGNVGPGVQTPFGIEFEVTSGELGLTPTALLCEDAVPGEPDTGSIDCVCGVPLEVPPHATDSDTSDFECCGVLIDKEVSCDNGTTWVDDDAPGPQLVKANDDGTNSCTALTGSNVLFQHFVKNVGTLACNKPAEQVATNFDDSQTQGGAVVIKQADVNLPVSENTVEVGTDVTKVCTTEFGAGEPNEAKLSCECSAPNLGTKSVLVTDRASVICQTVAVTIEKECLEKTDQGNAISIEIKNTGDVTLSNCQITDTYYPDSETCPPGDTDPALNPFLSDGGLVATLAPGATATVTGSIGDLAADTCNKAEVVCDVAGGGTITAGPAYDVCEVGEGCFTRTPGYWGTHPDQAGQVLTATGNPPGLWSCGMYLINTDAGLNQSTTEDICSQSEHNKISPVTSPQQTQLVRQCAAAALNLAVSEEAGLNCDTEFGGITAKFNKCCGFVDDTPTNAEQQGLCGMGLAPSAVVDGDTLTTCIGFLDEFNNAPFDLGDEFDDVSSVITNSKAQPEDCQDANGNKIRNTSPPGVRVYGPRK